MGPLTFASTTLRSVSRFALLAAQRQLHLRKDRLGAAAHDEGGLVYELRRETCAAAPESEGGAALFIWFQLKGVRPDTPRRNAFFWRINYATTPFFSGHPGYRFKLWTQGRDNPRYLGIYEFASPSTADVAGDYLTTILRFLSVPGSVAYRVQPTNSASRYLLPPFGSGEIVTRP
jgi:hypothetical protein